LVWVKRGIWLVVALAVVFAVYKGRSLLASSSAKSAAPTIATVPVSTGPVVETVSDPGTIESATSTTVVAEAAGPTDGDTPQAPLDSSHRA
jgi:multidrug efflux pump subunit AcrA (membrane-fusion protein)